MMCCQQMLGASVLFNAVTDSMQKTALVTENTRITCQVSPFCQSQNTISQLRISLSS